MTNSDKCWSWRFQNLYCSLFQIHSFVNLGTAQNIVSFVFLFCIVAEYIIVYLQNLFTIFKTMKYHFDFFEKRAPCSPRSKPPLEYNTLYYGSEEVLKI
jgi:hypothetical protein